MYVCCLKYYICCCMGGFFAIQAIEMAKSENIDEMKHSLALSIKQGDYKISKPFSGPCIDS